MDAARGTIAMTPRDAANVSASVRLTSGTSVFVHGGWVASGYAMPVSIVDVSSSTNCLSYVRFVTDAATCVADGSSCTIISVDIMATVDRSRVIEDASPHDCRRLSPHREGRRP
jgi:hypothetical protein